VYEFADNSKSCRFVIVDFLEGRDVPLGSNHLISVQIWITMDIQEYLTDFNQCVIGAISVRILRSSQ